MSGVGAIKGATCWRLGFRVDVLVEELRQEKGPIDEPADGFPDNSVRNATLRPEIEQFKSKLPDEALALK